MARKEIEVVLASAARTTDQTVDLETLDYSGIILIIDVTSVTATPSITVTLRGVDRVSGKTWTILAAAAISTVSTVVLEVYPGADETANLSENAYLPADIQIFVDHLDADSITYSVVAHLLP